MRFPSGAVILSTAMLSLGAEGQCEYSAKRSMGPNVLIAQQGIPLSDDLPMYGLLRTDAFLIGGSVYCAGTPDHVAYSLEDFLTRTDEQLAQAMDNFIETRFPNDFQVAYDPEREEYYSYVPEHAFRGMIIMDIEGNGLVAHPDNLLDHYRYSSILGMTGHELVDAIMAQYGKCADFTRRGFPESRIGLFGVIRGRRNGNSSEELVRKVEFFKLKAADPRNWLRNVDYLCPVVFSGWSPTDEVQSCSGSNPIRSCSARYLGMIDVTVRALTRGPLVEHGDCGGSPWEPDSGCANVAPELWTSYEPVRDAAGNRFGICPLLSVKIFNQTSCDDDRYLVEEGVDPTLENTLGVISGYLNRLVFERPACVVDCYAYWIDQEIDQNQLRQTMTRLAYPILGDYNDDRRVEHQDNQIFTSHWIAGRPAADMNGDGAIDAQDRCVMNELLGINCP
ncbi:MAG: hypothetical protein DYG94_04435 [Leptolyngbya sp. PLA3]|nr:MAG: hypothetical protein EDM82_07460 [Cyanobacteria bacterium CYA]MCE7967979.1 hypothetical protein [Leptolyngbya sp. PL-A3]